MLCGDTLHGIVVGHTSPVQPGATSGDAVLKQWMFWGCCFPLTDFICLFINTSWEEAAVGVDTNCLMFYQVSSLFEFVLKKYLLSIKWKESEIKYSNLVLRLGGKKKNYESQIDGPFADCYWAFYFPN